jgi:hypothetical protein
MARVIGVLPPAQMTPQLQKAQRHSLWSPYALWLISLLFDLPEKIATIG